MLRKRVMGLAALSMGTGMLLVLLVPGWGYFIASILVIVGFWLFFL